jgi:hypothetical protein
MIHRAQLINLFIVSTIAVLLPFDLLSQIDKPPIEEIIQPPRGDGQRHELRLEGSQPSKLENSQPPKKVIQWVQINGVELTEDRSSREKYLENEKQIKLIERKILDITKNDPDAKPKDPFETSQEYQIRTNRLNQKIEGVKNAELIPLFDIKNQYEDLYLLDQVTKIKIKIDLNDYNSDQNLWKINISDGNQLEQFCTISIIPEKARQLWENINQIDIISLRSASENNKYIIAVEIKNNPNFGRIFLERKEVDKDDIVYEKVEIPAFPDGKWRQYLERNISSFNPADEGAPAGTYTTYVQFIVDKEGNISDVKALTNHGYGMEDASIRIIKKGPKWNPAILNQSPVKSYRKQPITFRVEEQ